MMIGTDEEVRMKRARSNPVSPAFAPWLRRWWRRLLRTEPRSLPWFLAAAEDRFQHLIGIVAIDHRAQELANGFDAGRIDIANGAVDAVGLQAGELVHQCLALGGGMK